MVLPAPLLWLGWPCAAPPPPLLRALRPIPFGVGVLCDFVFFLHCGRSAQAHALVFRVILVGTTFTRALCALLALPKGGAGLICYLHVYKDDTCAPRPLQTNSHIDETFRMNGHCQTARGGQKGTCCHPKLTLYALGVQFFVDCKGPLSGVRCKCSAQRFGCAQRCTMYIFHSDYAQ